MSADPTDRELLLAVAGEIKAIGARQVNGGRRAARAEEKLRLDFVTQLSGLKGELKAELRADLEAHVEARVAPLALEIGQLREQLVLAKAPPTWASWAHAHPQAIVFLLTILAGALGLFGIKLPGNAEPPPAIVQPGAGSLMRGDDKLVRLGAVEG